MGCKEMYSKKRETERRWSRGERKNRKQCAVDVYIYGTRAGRRICISACRDARLLRRKVRGTKGPKCDETLLFWDF